MTEHCPDWMDGATPVIDTYALTYRYPWLVSSDGTHWGDRFSYLDWVFTSMRRRIAGLPQVQDTAGKTMRISLRPTGRQYRKFDVSAFDCASNSELSAVCIGGVYADGTVDSQVIMRVSGAPSVAAPTSLSETRFSTQFNELYYYGSGIYVQDGGTITSATLDIYNLTPGATITVTALCAASSTATNRQSHLILTAGATVESINVAANSNATQNYGAFPSVVVPADGHISIGLTATQASGYGVLSALAIDYA